MTVRRRKKKNRLRGQRSHGKGNTKHRRGAGSRGGRGRAGSHKHKWASYQGSFGLSRGLKPKRRLRALNLGAVTASLGAWKREKKVVEEKGRLVLDGRRLGVDKLLARGPAPARVLVRGLALTARARAKLQEAGAVLESEETARTSRKARAPEGGDTEGEGAQGRGRRDREARAPGRA